MTLDLELAGSGGRLAVLHREPDAAPHVVVLLAHGYGEHVGRYAHVVDRLTAHGAAVYGPDPRGHGRSDGERALVTDIEDLLADLGLVAETAHKAHPDLPVVLVGHSMGGIIATRYAQTHPGELAGLVLSGAVIGGNPQILALLGFDPIPEVPIDPAMLSRDPAVGDAYASDELVYHGPFLRPTLEAFAASVDRIADGPSLGTLPVLWVHGEQDPLAPLDVTAQAVRRTCGDRVTRRVYPEARHEVLNETNRDEVIGEVLAFLDEVAPG